MTALIVDDTNILRLVLKDILVKYCSIDETDIYETSNGTDAIKEYKAHRPDIVFLDIAMPDLDGKSVIGDILAFDPLAKVIMCTSSSDKNNIRDCLTVGAIDYIVKPPRLERVRQAVANAVELINTEKDVELRALLALPEEAPAQPAVQQNKGDDISFLKKEFSELKKEMTEMKAHKSDDIGLLKKEMAEIKRLLLQGKD
ncbi:MAG: response regulator [Oscillospiraceae bacterium]|nr:response regulator [Oscillospiraceae bacterium]